MRSVPEWAGQTDDSAIPPRVRLRVFQRFDGVCQCGCTRKIRSGDTWECDHVVALANGGKHIESNLQPLLVDCHKRKSGQDVAEKAKVDRIRKSHTGIKKRSSFACGRDSKWRKKINGQVVLR
jgi:5-methylcytosine-specific restriction protein A